MPSTVHKSTKAAVFVFVCLLATLISGVVLYFTYATPNATAMFLLAGCALVAFTLAVVAIRIAMGYRRSRKLELENNVAPSRLLRSLELRQWLILTLGISFLAMATGAATALRVVTADTEAAQAAPATATTTPPAAGPTTTEPIPEPATEEPSVLPGPTEAVEQIPSDQVTETPEDTPATKYLDSEDSLDGGFEARAVTFAAKRYPRGVEFWCSSATNSRLQWNVAGYKEFSTVAGIDDATEDAFGAAVEFIFYDQDGRQLVPKPVDVSVGHPRRVTVDLTGVVNLRMTCSGRDAKTSKLRSARSSLGDPVVTQ